MKRTLSLLIAAALALSACVAASGVGESGELPVPEPSFSVGLYASSTRVCAYSRVPPELVRLMRMSASDIREEYGFADCEAHIIYDCSIDGGETWLCSGESGELDAALGFDKAVGGDAVSDSEVFWLARESDAKKLGGAVLSVEDEHGLVSSVFDFDNKSLLLRAKYVVVMLSDAGGRRYYSSEWSTPQRLDGADGGSFNPSDAVAPEISDAVLVNGTRGEPLLKASIAFPDRLSDFIISVKTLALPELTAELEVSVGGGEWLSVTQSGEVSPYFCGRRTLSLEGVDVGDGEAVRLRARFAFEGDMSRGIAALTTPWSEEAPVESEYRASAAQTATATDTSEPEPAGGNGDAGAGIYAALAAAFAAVAAVVAAYLIFKRSTARA